MSLARVLLMEREKFHTPDRGTRHPEADVAGLAA
jgi:hypothetical protein